MTSDPRDRPARNLTGVRAASKGAKQAGKRLRATTELKPCVDCKSLYEIALNEWRSDTLAQQHSPEPKMPLRGAPHPGPRCYTHHKAREKALKARRHDKMVQKTYGMDAGEYAVLLAFQGGKCALCRRATGATKKLAVDHNHATGWPRGLLCGPCNQMLGHGRDSLEFFERVIAYLLQSPYDLMKQVENAEDWGELVTWGESILRVHKQEDCLTPCPIHAPSDHHMRNWPMIYRADRNIIERRCVHGIGHPDPDQISYWFKTLPEKQAEAEAIHGCDRCCNKGEVNGHD